MEPLKPIEFPNRKEVDINLIPYRSLDAALGKKGVNINNLVRIFSHIKLLHKNNPTVSTSFKNNVSYLGNGVEESRLDHTITKKGGGNGIYQIDNTEENKYRWNDYSDFIQKNGNTPESQTDFIIGEANDEILHLTKPDKNGKQTVTITNWTPWANKNGEPLRGQIAKNVFMDPNSSITDKTKALGEHILRPKSNVSLDKRAEYSNVIAFLFRDHKYKFGGRFTPKKSKLVKNAEEQNSKRDMRKKFIKSDRPTYTNNKVKKNQSGGVLSIDPSIFVSWNNISTSNIKLPEVDYTPKSNLDRFLERTENSESINLLGNPKEQEEKQDQKEIPVSKEEPIVKKTPLANPSKGNDAFNKIYDELIFEMPDAAEYRDFLTTVAKYESGFDSKAKNKYAPAWGYFQFMQDDNKYNNIKSYAGVDTQTFLNNPKLQIRAAINLAKAMEKGFTKEDIEAAKSKGISRWGMLGGAWLGGNGGLRKYLLQNINSSDKHWNPEGKGIDMENQIRRYNF